MFPKFSDSSLLGCEDQNYGFIIQLMPLVDILRDVVNHRPTFRGGHLEAITKSSENACSTIHFTAKA